MVNSSVPRAVPSAVAPSAGNDNVPVLTDPQLGPYVPATGKSVNPQVPRTETEGDNEISAQPGYGGNATVGSPPDNGQGAPSVPDMNGVLFRKGPIDSHYESMSEDGSPYDKVNNPPTRGMFTFIKAFANHIGLGTQNTDSTGFRQLGAQQRTSYMRVTPPPRGNGYAPQIYTPRQSVQAVRYNRIDTPVIGSDPYGSGVLNSDMFGAGQTAGGIGGNQYTPSPGPPETTSTAGNPESPSGMPTWG